MGKTLVVRSRATAESARLSLLTGIDLFNLETFHEHRRFQFLPLSWVYMVPGNPLPWDCRGAEGSGGRS